MSLTKVTYSMISGASVNVLDYGAVGDGATDDTAAFTAAIAALTAVVPNSAIGNAPPAIPAGGTVFIPNGTYKITSTISVNTNITLTSGMVSSRGNGENLYYGVVFYNAVSSGPCVLLARGGASIEGVLFVGLNATSAMGECVRCIAEYNRVKHCTFSGGAGANVIQVINQVANVDPVGVEIDSNTFTQFNAADPYACIFISGPTASSTVITNNQFNLNTVGAGGYIGTRCIKTDQAYTPSVYISNNNFFNAYYATTGSTPYPLVDLKVKGSFIGSNSFGPSNPAEPTNHYGLSLSGSDNVVTANQFGTYGGINVIAGSTFNEIGPQSYSGVTVQVLDSASGTDIFNQQAISFTPTLTFNSASTGLIYTAIGKYTKIRNVVTASYYIQLTAIGSASGLNIISLPITSNAGVGFSVTAGVADYDAMASIGNGGIMCKIAPSSNIAFLQTGSATTSTRLTEANFSDGSLLEFTIVYLSV